MTKLLKDLRAKQREKSDRRSMNRMLYNIPDRRVRDELIEMTAHRRSI